jgi:hypothetical protein
MPLVDLHPVVGIIHWARKEDRGRRMCSVVARICVCMRVCAGACLALCTQKLASLHVGLFCLYMSVFLQIEMDVPSHESHWLLKSSLNELCVHSIDAVHPLLSPFGPPIRKSCPGF